MSPNGYDFDANDLALLILRRYYPERTDGESAVIRDFLLEHGQEFDRFNFSRRIGAGLAPDPTHLPGVQRNTVFSTQKRIDLLAWRGSQPVIVEIKQRVSPACLGQCLTYRHLFQLEFPDAPEPEILVAGRESDPDTIGALNAHGITVYLYPQSAPLRLPD